MIRQLLWEQPAFKKRFKVIFDRRDRGLPAISVDEVCDYMNVKHVNYSKLRDYLPVFTTLLTTFILSWLTTYRYLNSTHASKSPRLCVLRRLRR